MEEQEPPVKRYTISQLAILYNWSVRTMQRNVKKVPNLGKRNGHWYTIPQVKDIFNFLGAPFLALFAWLVSACEALGHQSADYSLHPDTNSDGLNIDNHVIHDPVDTSTSTSNPALSVLGVLMMTSGIQTLIEISINHPRQRARYSTMNPHDAAMWETLRISAIVMQLIVVCIGVITLGYFFGKMIL